MRKGNTSTSTLISVKNTYQAEGLEQKLRRILANKEPISEDLPIIYTDKSEGVMPGYDIRTDRFEIARKAVEKIGIAAAQEKAKSQEIQKNDSGQ